jgi:signal transduction histidine kinase/CheY-like chemotaxis protein
MKLGEIIRKDFSQLVFVFLSFFFMVLVSYFYVSRIVEKQIFNHARELLLTAETAIHSDFREGEMALFNTEIIVQEMFRDEKGLKGIQPFLVQQARLFSSDISRVRGFVDIYYFISGSLFTGSGWTPSEDYAPYERPWYTAALEANGSIAVTAPYFDLNRSTVITLSKTIQIEGVEEVGVIAIDLNFSMIADYVLSIQFATGGYGVLMDEDFFLLAHPNRAYIGTATERLSPAHAKFVQKLRKAAPDDVIIQQMPNWRETMMVLVSKQIFNHWFLGIATPVISYYRDVYVMAVSLSILGAIFMTILSAFLVRLSVLRARSDRESQEKTSFLARMSHEIRTPMNSILGMAELIQRKAISSDVKEYVDILYHSGLHLLAIINDILDFSRIESNRLQIESREYHIASVINDTINVVRPRAADKSLDFLVNMDSDIPAQLIGDDGRLRQILTNILSNAVKYTRKGFISLLVSMEWQDEQSIKLFFSVEDSGIGIKPEDMARLFNEFSRLDAQANHGIEGTGLGLVITRALCRAMGGDIVVTSEYGKGSVFKASIVQEVENTKPAAQVLNPETKRVVFFDWRPRFVQSITQTFKSLGIKPVCSANLPAFMNALEQGQYDYAFISSNHALDCIYKLGKRNDPIQLVIMVELGEVSVFREVSSIMMPVYSVPLASILNNKQIDDGIHNQHVQLTIQFTAPDATALIVDDISTNLRVAKELMSPYNINIHTCLSGAEAVELVKQNRYDLVFMDHMMPGMDGIEATARIREWEAAEDDKPVTGEPRRRLPIIALTANAVTGQREMFLENGINDFLAKPIDIQKLNDILEKWLPGGKKIRARPAAVSVPVEETAGASDTIVIPGIDIEQGLRNTGGSLAGYFGILLDFCRDAESLPVRISEALENGDIQLYITLVHALKGAARSIGAMEIGEAAAALETKSANMGAEDLRRKTAELLENLGLLADNIRNAEIQREAAESREQSDISALNLEALKAALAGMDVEAVNKMLLEYAGMPLDKISKKHIAELEQYILMFEYDKAIEKINELF